MEGLIDRLLCQVCVRNGGHGCPSLFKIRNATPFIFSAQVYICSRERSIFRGLFRGYYSLIINIGILFSALLFEAILVYILLKVVRAAWTPLYLR